VTIYVPRFNVVSDRGDEYLCDPAAYNALRPGHTYRVRISARPWSMFILSAEQELPAPLDAAADALDPEGG
jgi:hypothetical protein